MSEDLAHLVADLPNLGSSAYVYNELTRAMNDPESSMRDFGRIIENDPVLMAKLLRLANSVFFGYPSKVNTLEEALIIIGVQQVRDLVASATVMDYFKDLSPELINMDSFWQHSLGCGLSARILASHRRDWNPEQAFAAGLMHDLGRLVMLIRVPEEVQKVFERAEQDSRPLIEIEKELLGYDHAELGGVLLECWNFPDNLIQAVAHHHAPMTSATDPIDASLVHFGNALAHALELGASGERFVPEVSEPAWAKLGLGMDVLRPSVKEIDRQFDEVVGMFITS